MNTPENALSEEPPVSSGWIATKLTQIWVRIDGLLHRVMGIEQALKNERGPDPDADWQDTQQDLRDLIRQATREGARRANIDIETYQEGGGGSWKDTSQKVIVGLLILGIAGNVVMYARVASVEAKMDQLQSRFQDLQKLVEPRYRGPE